MTARILSPHFAKLVRLSQHTHLKSKYGSDAAYNMYHWPQILLGTPGKEFTVMSVVVSGTWSDQVCEAKFVQWVRGEGMISFPNSFSNDFDSRRVRVQQP